VCKRHCRVEFKKHVFPALLRPGQGLRGLVQCIAFLTNSGSNNEEDRDDEDEAEEEEEDDEEEAEEAEEDGNIIECGAKPFLGLLGGTKTSGVIVLFCLLESPIDCCKAFHCLFLLLNESDMLLIAWPIRGLSHLPFHTDSCLLAVQKETSQPIFAQRQRDAVAVAGGR